MKTELFKMSGILVDRRIMIQNTQEIKRTLFNKTEQDKSSFFRMLAVNSVSDFFSTE